MKSILNIAAAALILWLTACSAPPAVNDTLPAEDIGVTGDLNHSPSTAAEWLERYIDGLVTKDELCQGLEPYSQQGVPALATTPGVHVFSGSETVTADVSVGMDTTLVLLKGSELILGDGVTFEVLGRFFALGDASAPVRIASQGTYKTVRLQGAQSQCHHTHFAHGIDLVTVAETGAADILFTSCEFEHWDDVALRFTGADGLAIVGCSFGLQSAGEAHGECLNGKRSGARIEDSVFGQMTAYSDAMDLEDCHGDHVPHIVGNTLLGGQDDGIDLDDCDALVANNLVMDFWPADPANPYKGVNGGGITGHNSHPLLINNVVLRCFHGIGFKNGARPVLIHNTITDGHIGVSLYRTNSGYDDPHGTLINNIIVNNQAFDSGANQDLLLHGRWWPSYDQTPGNQASVELQHNLFGFDMGGQTDRVGTPGFEWKNDLPFPAPDSLPVAAGLKLPVTVPGFPSDSVEVFFAEDYAGISRSQDAPTLGALEVHP
jgi:hypothetical protein